MSSCTYERWHPCLDSRESSFVHVPNLGAQNQTPTFYCCAGSFMVLSVLRQAIPPRTLESRSGLQLTCPQIFDWNTTCGKLTWHLNPACIRAPVSW